MFAKPVYVIDGARTPFLKARGKPGPFSAADLAQQAGRALLLRQAFAAEELDEVILGCAAPSADEPNIARVVSLRLGCGEHVPAFTVMRNCASGMQAIDSGIANITSGRSKLVLAGGVDALSRAPILFSEAMVLWLAAWYAAKSWAARVRVAADFRPHFLAPVIGLVRGLTDPVVNLSMGQTAENVARRFGIGRDAMDAYAVESHHRLAQAQDAGFGREIVPLVAADGTIFEHDDGLRRDSSVESLAKLKPYFDRRDGNVTAGNSSQITDGAAWLLLGSEDEVRRRGIEPLGRITDSQWAGLDPAQMGLGPVHAATPLLLRNDLALGDIDAWEINEAFAAQLLGCLAAWRDATYCQEELGLVTALGEVDRNKLNLDGGAIALGHPVGASGARIVLHLLHVLRRLGGRRGIASLCIGGGQGGAMLVEV
jgi:acetyl-CoA C-acetyltransferase